MITLAWYSALRFLRTPRAWGSLAIWIALALGDAIVLRVARTEGATDRLLLGFFAPFVLPLFALAALGAVAGRDGPLGYARKLGALGASGARAGLACAITGAIVAALGASLAGGLALLVAHGPGDPALARDALTTAWVAALGGATWAAFLALGSTFGKSGWGRGVFLVLGWLLADGGSAAALSPHAHVRSLLGGPLAAELPQRASGVALGALCAISLALVALRCRARAR